MDRDTAIALLAACDKSTKVGCSVVFPERFTRPFDPVHDEIFKLIDKKPGTPGYKNKKALAAPRGLGKTSIVSLGVPGLAILLQRFDYIVMVGENATNTQEKSENLKRELMSNELIRALYGDISTDHWSKESWVCRVGTKEIMIRPRGAGQAVRGMLFRNSRPGLIVIDDLEDPENMDNPDQRIKKKQWFYADLMNCVDRSRNDWEIIMLGTVLHHDSLLEHVLNSPDWDSVRLEICDDEFHSHAPNFMSDRAIKALYEEYKEAEQLDVFYREYRNNPSAGGEDAVFQPRFFAEIGYEESAHNLNRDPRIENVVLVDPSRTAKMNAAPTGIIGLGVDIANNLIYVRDCISARLHPEEVYENVGSMMKRLNARVLGVEVTGLHEFIVHPLKNFLSRQGIFGYEFVELQARGGQKEDGKTARVRTLVDYYRYGLVRHNKMVTEELERQLLAFPFAKNWSLMDPFGYITEMLETGERYFQPKNEASLEDRKAIEAEFNDLIDDYDELDKRPMASWRSGNVGKGNRRARLLNRYS